MKKKSFPLGYSYIKFEQGGALKFDDGGAFNKGQIIGDEAKVKQWIAEKKAGKTPTNYFAKDDIQGRRIFLNDLYVYLQKNGTPEEKRLYSLDQRNKDDAMLAKYRDEVELSAKNKPAFSKSGSVDNYTINTPQSNQPLQRNPVANGFQQRPQDIAERNAFVNKEKTQGYTSPMTPTDSSTDMFGRQQGYSYNNPVQGYMNKQIKKQQGGLVFKNGGTVPCYDCGGKIKSYQKGEVLKLKDIRRENQSDVIDYQDKWNTRGFSDLPKTDSKGNRVDTTYTTSNQIGLGKDYIGTAVKDEYVNKQTGKVTLPGNNPVNRTKLGLEIENKNVQTQNLLDNPEIVKALFNTTPQPVKWGVSGSKMLNIYTDPASGITLWFDPSSGRAGYKGVSNAKPGQNGQDALHAVKTISMTKNTIPPTPPVDNPKGNSGLNYKIKVMTVNPKGARVDTDLFFVAHLGKNGKAVFRPGGNGSGQDTAAITPFTQDFPLGTHDTDVLNLLNNPEEERNIRITGDLLNGKKMVEGQ